MNSFFILKKYRRKGIGTAIALNFFELFPMHASNLNRNYQSFISGAMCTKNGVLVQKYFYLPHVV
jgi:hypothetical protein